MNKRQTPSDARQPLPPPVFLERQSYRRRRLMDGARLLPLFGLGLFLVPLLWPTASTDGTGHVPSMSRAMLYLFGAWAGLIILAAAFGSIARHFDLLDPPEK